MQLSQGVTRYAKNLVNARHSLSNLSIDANLATRKFDI